MRLSLLARLVHALVHALALALPGRRALSCRPPPHAPHPRYSHPPPPLLHLLAHSPFPPAQLLVHACAIPAHSQADCRAPQAGAGPPQPTALAPAQRAVCDRFAQLQVRPRHPFAPSHACPAASARPLLGECRLVAGVPGCPQAPQSAPLAARRSRSRIYAHVAATPCAGLAAALRRRHARSPSARSTSSTRCPCPSAPACSCLRSTAVGL